MYNLYALIIMVKMDMSSSVLWVLGGLSIRIIKNTYNMSKLINNSGNVV